MVNTIKSVSMTLEEADFLKDYNLSPTQLLKEKIWEMRGMIKSVVQNKIDKMVVVIHEQAATIEKLENVLEKENQSPKLS